MYENRDSFSLPLNTQTTIGGTGATTMVAAPGAGKSIVLDMFRIQFRTDTTADIECFFRGDTTGSGRFRTLTNLTSTAMPIFVQLEQPWILPSNSVLQFVLSVTAASTPAADIEVTYRILTQ